MLSQVLFHLWWLLSILDWSRTCFSSAFCLRMLMLNCRMFRLFVLLVDLLRCVVCEIKFIVVLTGVHVCGVSL